MPRDATDISGTVSGWLRIDSSFVVVDAETRKAFELYQVNLKSKAVLIMEVRTSLYLTLHLKVKENSAVIIKPCGNITIDNKDFDCLVSQNNLLYYIYSSSKPLRYFALFFHVSSYQKKD